MSANHGRSSTTAPSSHDSLLAYAITKASFPVIARVAHIFAVLHFSPAEFDCELYPMMPIAHDKRVAVFIRTYYFRRSIGMPDGFTIGNMDRIGLAIFVHISRKRAIVGRSDILSGEHILYRLKFVIVETFTVNRSEERDFVHIHHGHIATSFRDSFVNRRCG